MFLDSLPQDREAPSTSRFDPTCTSLAMNAGVYGTLSLPVVYSPLTSSSFLDPLLNGRLKIFFRQNSRVQIVPFWYAIRAPPVYSTTYPRDSFNTVLVKHRLFEDGINPALKALPSTRHKFELEPRRLDTYGKLSLLASNSWTHSHHSPTLTRL